MKLPKLMILPHSRPVSSPPNSPSPPPASPPPPPQTCSATSEPRPPKRLRFMCMHLPRRIARSRSVSSNDDAPSAGPTRHRDGLCASPPAAASASQPALSGNPAGAASLISRIASPHALLELREVFAQFDANGDGKISPDELCSVFRSLSADGGSLRCTPREASLMVAEIDSDGDGLIDLHDFFTLNAGRTEEVVDDDLVAAFRVFDRNKDGLISAEELHAILSALQTHQTAGEQQPATAAKSSCCCSLDDCRRMIRGVDRKGTGCVDLDDFKRMMTLEISA